MNPNENPESFSSQPAPSSAAPLTAASSPSTAVPDNTDPSSRMSSVGAKAAGAVENLKSSAASAASRVKNEATEAAAQRKSGIADRLGNYSQEMHRSADALGEEDSNIGWLTHRAAERLESAADYLRARDFSELKRDAEDLARRHPALFLGGLFAVGLVLGNVVKATQRSSSYNDNGDSYPRGEDVPAADQPELDPWPAPTGAQGESL